MNALVELGCKAEFGRNEDSVIIHPPGAPSVDLLKTSTKVIKSELKKWTRSAILTKLASDVNKPEPRRKDLVGISSDVDIRTTMAMSKVKSSPVDSLKTKQFQQRFPNS